MNAEEHYLGDGLYCFRDLYGIVWLRSPRPEGDHFVALEPEVLAEFLRWLNPQNVPSELEPELVRCTACIDGRWEAECCNGSNGCSCHGEPVDMGRCNVCGGTGRVRKDAPASQLRANMDAIRGRCYLGSGPRR